MEDDEDFENRSLYAWSDSNNSSSNAFPAANSTNTTAVKGSCKNPAYFYAMGVVIPSGFISNIFCLTVFSFSAGLRRTTTGHYLSALACADTLFLVGDFMRWLNSDDCLGFNFMHTSNVACKLIFWLRYGAKLVSAWVTVSIATERFITVAFPLKVSLLSTVGRAKVIILALFVSGFSFGSYTLWTLESDTPKNPALSIKCVTPQRLRDLYNLWNTVVLATGTLLAPGLLITVLTVMTVVILLRASRRRREHMEGQPALPGSGGGPLKKTLSAGGGRGSSSSAAERQLTVTLIAVCVAFIVLRLPYTIVYLLSESFNMKTWPNVKVGLTVGRLVTDVIATSNYVVNLMLYCLFGSYFRQQVVVVYGCRQRGKHFGSARSSARMTSVTNVILKSRGEYSSGKSRSSTVTRASIV